MEPLDYFQFRNIYVVCYVPLRLNCAVYVRRVLEQLQFDSNDAIVLPYPVNIAEFFKGLINKLPQQPVVLKSENLETRNQSVIPVFNNDAAAEAMRYALENKITVEYAGAHVPLNDPYNEWEEFITDDSVLLETGMNVWFQSIKNQIHPCTYKVSHKYNLHKIFEASYIFSKVFLPVPVNDFEELIKILPGKEYDFGNKSPHESDSTIAFELYVDEIDDSEIKTNMLDNVPGFCEIYEKYRKEKQAVAFSKWNALLRIMKETDAEWGDMEFSMHHYLAFSQLMQNRHTQKNNSYLTVDAIFSCIETIFNKTFAYRVKEKLLNYFEKKIHIVNSSDGARGCDTRYDNVSWPGYKKLISDMMSKLHKQASKSAETKFEILPFKGSLKRGVHVKKTLTNFFKGREEFFVKDQKIIRIFLDNKEPVVFINRDYNNIEQYCDFCCIWVGKNNGEQFTANWQYGFMEPVNNVNIEEFSIYRYGFKGLAFFCDPLRHLEKLKSMYDNETEFSNRVPLRRQRDPLLSKLERDVYKSKIEWDEALLFSAINYSKKAVILIAPPHYKLPASANLRLTQEN
ncbi:MAG: hypothetical protein ABI855_00510, partial [Bacteroidota bacterium]